MIAPGLLGGPFDSILDVGGNVGDFAEWARLAWPDAWLTSFEPLPELAEVQFIRAAGRWAVEEVAVSDRRGTAVLQHCVNQHSASSLQPLGGVRREVFGIQDRLQPIEVQTAPLDDFLADAVEGSLLVKIDVEGHERQVLAGAARTLRRADAVLIEVQNDPGIFVGAASPGEIDRLLREAGLAFAGVASCFASPAGRVLQFDAVYLRDPASR